MPCPEHEVGEIWARGPHIARGYWNGDAGDFQARTAAGRFCAPEIWGFLCAGELFVTGRLKDLIIIAGRNHAPHDIEAPVAGSHAALATDGCAAFGMDVENSEVLAVVAEVARGTGAGETQAIAQAIRRAVAEKHDLRAHTVQLIRAATLPRTSSGKVRRAACRDQLAAATLNALADGS